MATATNIAVVNNPDTMRNEATQALEDGTNVIAPVFTLNGRRSSDMVNIHAVSAIVRLHVIRNPDLEDDVTYTDRIKFKFGFYTWTKINANGFLDETDLPDIRTLIKWLPVGYSNQLDNLEAGIMQGLPYATRNLNMIMNSEKVRKLVEKDITVKVPRGAPNVPEYRQIRIYKEFKDPIQIQYDPLSQDGSDTVNLKLFFAIRSDLPTSILTQIEPNAQICTKVYYSNVV